MAALFLYYILFSIIACYMLVSTAQVKRDFEIARLKAKLDLKKFWIKHYKDEIKNLEELSLDQKAEIATLNDTVNALEDAALVIDDEEYEDDDDEEEEEDERYKAVTVDAKGYKN